MTRLIAIPEIQIVAVGGTPSKYAIGYRDWGRDGLLSEMRSALGKPDWRAGSEGTIPGGRDVAKDFVETYYAAQRPGGTFKGCSSYADFRELLSKEKELDAVNDPTSDRMLLNKSDRMHPNAWALDRCRSAHRFRVRLRGPRVFPF